MGTNPTNPIALGANGLKQIVCVLTLRANGLKGCCEISCANYPQLLPAILRKYEGLLTWEQLTWPEQRGPVDCARAIIFNTKFIIFNTKSIIFNTKSLIF